MNESELLEELDCEDELEDELLLELDELELDEFELELDAELLTLLELDELELDEIELATLDELDDAVPTGAPLPELPPSPPPPQAHSIVSSA